MAFSQDADAAGLRIVLRMIDTRQEQRRWLEGVLSRTGTAPTALAQRAGLAVTTITRFLNDPEHATALSHKTIKAIERSTGVPYGQEQTPGMREPEAAPWQADGAEPTLRDLVVGIVGKANGTDPWVLKSRALESAGYMPGDILVVDMNRTPLPGDVVCVQAYNWREGSAQTLFRIWEPPYLVAASLDPQHRKPLVVDNENVIIRGVVCASLRARMGRAA